MKPLTPEMVRVLRKMVRDDYDLRWKCGNPSLSKRKYESPAPHITIELHLQEWLNARTVQGLIDRGMLLRREGYEWIHLTNEGRRAGK